MDKIIKFDNCQENVSDGTTNRAYYIFFEFFICTSLIPALLWGFIFGIFIIAFIIRIETLSATPLDFFINPFNFIFLIFIISSIFIFRPMHKVKTIQDQNTNRKKFNFYRFLSVIFIWFILFSAYSLVFSAISTNPNPKMVSCEICGNTNQFLLYEFTENEVVIHRYCAFHAIDVAFLNPIVILRNPPTHGAGFGTKFEENDVFILLGALISIYTWVFVIGFALILGSGYTWEKNLERKI